MSEATFTQAFQGLTDEKETSVCAYACWHMCTRKTWTFHLLTPNLMFIYSAEDDCNEYGVLMHI